MDIQVGDLVTYKNSMGNIRQVVIKDEEQKIKYINNVDTYKNILKIERPKYEVVEEKKELLTEEEKEFLKQALKFGNYGSNTENETVKFICQSGYYICLYYDEWANNTIYIDNKLYFRNLIEDKKYTLKELGLEEN